MHQRRRDSERHARGASAETRRQTPAPAQAATATSARETARTSRAASSAPPPSPRACAPACPTRPSFSRSIGRPRCFHLRAPGRARTAPRTAADRRTHTCSPTSNTAPTSVATCRHSDNDCVRASSDRQQQRRAEHPRRVDESRPTVGRPNISIAPPRAAGWRRARRSPLRSAAHQHDQSRHGARQEERKAEAQQRQQSRAAPSTSDGAAWIVGEPLGQRSVHGGAPRRRARDGAASARAVLISAGPCTAAARGSARASPRATTGAGSSNACR